MTTKLKRETFNVLTFLKKSRILKNGNYPIAVRITVNAQPVEISLHRDIHTSAWNQQKGLAKGKDKESTKLNDHIRTVQSRIYEIYNSLVAANEIVTSQRIKDKYLKKDEQKAMVGICKLYEEHNERCAALIGIDYSESTIVKFRSTLKSLREFILVKYGADDYNIQDIAPDFMRDYEFYLKVSRGCQHNSAVKNMKNLKKIVRGAVTSGILDKDPLAACVFKEEEVDTEFLTREEMVAMENKVFASERLTLVRDVFIFCCLTGLAYSDVAELSDEHLYKDANGNIWIKKRRRKTKVQFNVPLLAPAIALLEKYKDKKQQNAKGLLPVISNVKMNEYLKEIADVCGINKRLTTHVARHTCATTVMLAHKVSIENVAKILGHKNIKMTQHYAKVLDSSIMNDMGNVMASFG